MNEFNDIVDTTGLSPEEAARLRRVHDLLVEAGPPADLPPALEQPADPAEAQVIDFPLMPPRRWAAVAIAAAALAAVALGGGYLLGHAHAKPASFAAHRVVPMQGHGLARRAADRQGRQGGQLADGAGSSAGCRRRRIRAPTTSCG